MHWGLQWIAAVFRFVMISLGLVVLPCAVLGFLAGERAGGEIGIAVGIALSWILSMSAERLLGRFHGVSRESETQGLRHSLATVLRQRDSQTVPRIRIFPDPSPNAFVVRSWSGRGTLFVSQGLLTFLLESELRAVLWECLDRLDSPALVPQSLGALLAALFLARAPRDWVQVSLGGKPLRRGLDPKLSPARLVVFATAYWLARVAVKGAGVSTPVPVQDPLLAHARQKIQKELGVWPLAGNPGAVSLYLLNPWPGSSLMSLS